MRTFLDSLIHAASEGASKSWVRISSRQRLYAEMWFIGMQQGSTADMEPHDDPPSSCSCRYVCQLQLCENFLCREVLFGLGQVRMAVLALWRLQVF